MANFAIGLAIGLVATAGATEYGHSMRGEFMFADNFTNMNHGACKEREEREVTTTGILWLRTQTQLPRNLTTATHKQTAPRPAASLRRSRGTSRGWRATSRSG